MKQKIFALTFAYLLSGPAMAQQPNLLSLIGNLKTLAGGPISSEMREVLLGVRKDLGLAKTSGVFQCDADNIEAAHKNILDAANASAQTAAGNFHWVINLYTDCALAKGFKSPWVEGDVLARAMLEFRPRASEYMWANSDGIKSPPFELNTIKRLADYAGASNGLQQEIDRQIAAEERLQIEKEQAEAKRREQIESAKNSPTSRIADLDGFCIDRICLGQPIVLYESQLARLPFDRINEDFPRCEDDAWTSRLKGASGKEVEVSWYSWPASNKGLHARIGKISSSAQGEFIKEQARAIFDDKLVGGLREVKKTKEALPSKPVAPAPLRKELETKISAKRDSMTDRERSDFLIGGRWGRLPTPVENSLSAKEKNEFYAWTAADRKYQESLAKYRSAVFLYSATGKDDDRFMARKTAIAGYPEISEVTLMVSYAPNKIEVAYEVIRNGTEAKLKVQPACLTLAQEIAEKKLKETPKF